MADIPLVSLGPPLLTNKGNSHTRFKKPEVLEQYHNIMQEQIEQGIVEEATEGLTGEHEFYLPHKPIFKETAETTKIRIVFDASSKESQSTLPLTSALIRDRRCSHFFTACW